MQATAILSVCTKYRYSLARQWGPTQRQVLFIGLNPSKADAEADDPTIRRMIGFARSWGFDGLRVVNLFALRSTDPRGLFDHPDPSGPENDAAIVEQLAAARAAGGAAVPCWGSSKMQGFHVNRALRVTRLLWAQHVQGPASQKLSVDCLGRVGGGHPRHPLYVPRVAPLQSWFDPDTDPDLPRCSGCGCTEQYGCVNGCWWVRSPDMRDRCSNCLGLQSPPSRPLRPSVQKKE